MIACLNQSSGLSLQRLQQQCRQQAQDAFKEAGGDAANFALQLQKHAEDAALETAAACLSAANATSSALAASYKSSRMDAGTAALFQDCLNQSLPILVQQGGLHPTVATLESALQRQLGGKAVAAAQACLGGGGNTSSCSRQARDALKQAGVPPQEVNRRAQDDAASQAASTFASCQRSGGGLVNCTSEASVLFSSLGGDASQFNAMLQRAVSSLVTDQAKACRAAASDATELKACDIASAQSYRSMGGDPHDFKEQRDKAAGAGVAAQLRDCIESSTNESSKRGCAAKAKTDFESTGASGVDFQQSLQTAAQQLAVSTQQSCLTDAGCSVDGRTGRRMCKNEAAAVSCAQAGQELLRQASGKDSISATDLKVAAQKVGRRIIGDEMSGCVATKMAGAVLQVLVRGSPYNCQPDDGNQACQEEAASACRQTARDAFVSAGGVPADFKREQQAAARESLSNRMKGCMRDQFDGGNLTANISGKVVGCTWDLSSNTTECMAAARDICDSAALLALVQSGGSPREYYQQRAKASANALADAVSACVDGLLAAGNGSVTADMAAACARLDQGCADAGGLRQAAAIACKQSAKTSFQLAGGDMADLELLSRHQARAATGDAYLSCQRLSDAELAAAGATAVVNGSAPTGRRRAACLEEARSALQDMGISASVVHRELRRSAALQSSDRMKACLEDAGFGTGMFLASGDAAALVAGVATAAETNASFLAARLQCRNDTATAVVQAGGPPGVLQKLFREGPRLAAADAVRQCVRALQREAVAANGSAAQPDPADVQSCRALGAAEYLASGGEPGRYAEESARAARAASRESIWACLSASGTDLAGLQRRAWGTNRTARVALAAAVANCSAAALGELAAVAGNQTNGSVWQLAQMRREAAEEEFEAQLDADAGGAGRSLDQAAGSLAALGADSPESAEAELMVQMGCQPLGTTLCPRGMAGPLVLAGGEVCCSGVPVQSVNLTNASVVLGAGAVQVSGPGNLSSAQTDLERYCLGSADGPEDPACEDVTQQTAASVSGSGELGVQGTTIETGATNLTDGAVLNTGVELVSDSSLTGRRLADQRASRSGYFQSTASVLGNASLRGQGRVDLGRAEVLGEVQVHSDMVVSRLDVTNNATVHVRGRMVLSPDIGVDGNVSGGAAGRISVEGSASLVVDASEDLVGGRAGLAAMLSIWNGTGMDQNATNQSAWRAAACLRACRQDPAVQAALAQCRNSDTRSKDGAPARRASDVAGIDCGTTMKSCNRRCLLGPQRKAVRQQLSHVVLASGGVTAGRGVHVEIDRLAVNGSGQPPMLLGTPDDAAQHCDEAGRPLPGNASRRSALVVRNISGSATLSAGCDLSGFVADGSQPAACVELPSTATVSQLLVHLPAGDTTAAMRGRRVVRFPGGVPQRNSTLPSGSRRLQSSLSISVVDSSGSEVSGSFQLCCFDDGFGLGPLGSSAAECPPCSSTSTSTTMKPTSATISGTSRSELAGLVLAVLALQFMLRTRALEV